MIKNKNALDHFFDILGNNYKYNKSRFIRLKIFKA